MRECFKSIRQDPNLRKGAKPLFIFLTTPNQAQKYVEKNYSDNFVHQYNVEFFYLFDQELQLINTNAMIKSKLKELLNEIKKSLKSRQYYS